jgi:hypothetical protein
MAYRKSVTVYTPTLWRAPTVHTLRYSKEHFDLTEILNKKYKGASTAPRTCRALLLLLCVCETPKSGGVEKEKPKTQLHRASQTKHFTINFTYI